MERNRLIIIVALVVITALPRVFDLGTFMTADEKRWLANVAGFTTKLSQGRINDLLQQPHPGITTQWFAAPTVWSDSWQIRKLPLVLSQIVLIWIAGYLAKRVWDERTAALLVLLLALNPLLIAHTRVYAMDSLLAIFVLITLLALLAWKRTQSTRFIAYAGAGSALAMLSKLPGIIMVPFTSGALILQYAPQKRIHWRPLIVYSIAVLVTLAVVFPSLITNTIPVLQNIASFFSSGDYTELHQESSWYYIHTLIFFSTPIQMLAVIMLPFTYHGVTKKHRQELTAMLVLAVLFVIMMSLGAKKGDRYILPVFLILDTIAAFTIANLPRILRHRSNRWVTAIVIILTAWQAIGIWQLHPYYLSYVNPITKPLFGQQRLGWGEGLDLAANYLNQKPNAANLTVAAYYPNEFGNYFVGKAIPLHEWNNGGADYAVLYRAQFGRGPDAWETDVLQQFANKQPEYTITLNGLEYAWIYPLVRPNGQ